MHKAAIMVCTFTELPGDEGPPVVFVQRVLEDTGTQDPRLVSFNVALKLMTFINRTRAIRLDVSIHSSQYNLLTSFWQGNIVYKYCSKEIVVFSVNLDFFITYKKDSVFYI